MKKLTIALLFPIISFSQLRFNYVEYFTISMINDTRASVKEGGFYIGGELEYVGKIYTRIGVDNFAVLEDGYTAVVGLTVVMFLVGLLKFKRKKNIKVKRIDLLSWRSPKMAYNVHSYTFGLG